jgi:sortase (surface protein transpeptidase)
MANLFASIKAWRSGKTRRPRFLRSSKKSWRAKKIALDFLPTRSVLITIRRFKTSKQNRAKTYKQFVIPLYFWPGKVQELALCYKKFHFNLAGLWRAVSIWLIVGGLFGGVYFSQRLLYTDPNPPQVVSLKAPSAFEQKPSTQEGLKPSEPVRVKVPAIAVDATVATVGQNTDGTMQTPSLFDHNVGWYKLGPTPGEIGPAIMVGHVDNYKGPSVFWRLAELRPGDTIEIVRKDGQTVVFQVVSAEQFDQNAFPTEKVYGNIENAGLRLITCGGTFNQAAGRYTHNTVILANMITTRASQ